jgi:hypothetical protein
MILNNFRRGQNDALFILNFKTYTMSQADIIRAGRDKPLIHPVMAEVAFLGDISVHVIGDGIVRAFLNAGLTAGTHIIVHNDDTVVSFDDGLYRTGFGTWWRVAVPAQVDLKRELRLVIDPPWAVFPHRYQVDPPGRPVFLLAGHHAGPTAPTQLFINFKFKARHIILLQFNLLQKSEKSEIRISKFETNSKMK